MTPRDRFMTIPTNVIVTIVLLMLRPILKHTNVSERAILENTLFVLSSPVMLMLYVLLTFTIPEVAESISLRLILGWLAVGDAMILSTHIQKVRMKEDGSSERTE